jgi:PIN domain nuclease of toxin-antitoxin system
MARPVLFDTCAAIWFMEDAPFSSVADRAVQQTLAAGTPIAVSPITAWEIGLLVSKKRLTLDFEPLEWFERMMREPGMQLAEMPPRVLIESNRLPGEHQTIRRIGSSPRRRASIAWRSSRAIGR